MHTRYILVLIIFLGFALSCYGQILQPAKWSYDVSHENPQVGDEIDLIFYASIDQDWYLYSTDFDPELGPLVTEFTFEPHDSYELVGGIRPIGSKRSYDEIWEGEYTYFKEKGEFRQTIKILKEEYSVSGSYMYQVCSDIDGKCIPFDEEFVFGIASKNTSTSEGLATLKTFGQAPGNETWLGKRNNPMTPTPRL